MGDLYYTTINGGMDNVCPMNLRMNPDFAYWQPAVKRIGRAVSTTELKVEM